METKFLIQLSKIKQDRKLLIILLADLDQEKQKLKNNLQRASIPIKQGGIPGHKRSVLSMETKNQLALLTHKRTLVTISLSEIKKKDKYHKNDTQKYSGKIASIFMVVAKRTLPENEFKKIEKKAEKILEDRRNNIQTWE